MLSNARELILVLLKARHDVDGEVLFSGRKASEEVVSLAARVVLVVILAKPDHRVAPHHGRLSCHAFHHLEQYLAVGAFSLILDPGDKGAGVGIRRLGLVLGHGRVLQSEAALTTRFGGRPASW